MTGIAVAPGEGGRKEGRMMEQETERERQRKKRARKREREREREREGAKEGRKEETPNSSADTEQTKDRKWKRAHASSCQLRDTPPTYGPLHKLEASPSACPTPLASSSSSHQGVDVEASDIKKKNVLRLILCIPQLTALVVLLNQMSDITNGRTQANTSM